MQEVLDIEVEKLSTITAIHEANAFTSGHESGMGLATAYHMQHSTIRTQLFKIKFHSVPTKVSVHFVRHSAVGQLHFVKTRRTDRWLPGESFSDLDINRKTPIEHLMYLNAQHLIDMARKRLCSMSDKDTIKWMHCLREEVREVDPALAARMQKECLYRGGYCFEGKNSCGYAPLAGINHYKDIRLLIAKKRENT